MLIFVGVVFFVGIGLAVLIDQRARQRGDVEIFKRLFFGLVPLPWIVAILLSRTESLTPLPPTASPPA